MCEDAKKTYARVLFIRRTTRRIPFWLHVYIRDNEITLGFPDGTERNHCRRFRENRIKNHVTVRAPLFKQETRTSFSSGR